MELQDVLSRELDIIIYIYFILGKVWNLKDQANIIEIAFPIVGYLGTLPNILGFE